MQHRDLAVPGEFSRRTPFFGINKNKLFCVLYFFLWIDQASADPGWLVVSLSSLCTCPCKHISMWQNRTTHQTKLALFCVRTCSDYLNILCLVVQSSLPSHMSQIPWPHQSEWKSTRPEFLWAAWGSARHGHVTVMSWSCSPTHPIQHVGDKLPPSRMTYQKWMLQILPKWFTWHWLYNFPHPGQRFSTTGTWPTVPFWKK